MGSPTVNITTYLYLDNGTYGVGYNDDTPIGNALAISNSINASDITTSVYNLYQFDFDGTYRLVEDIKYCIELAVWNSTGTIDLTNYIAIGLDGASPTHGGVMNFYQSDNWYSIDGVDTLFYLYGLPITDHLVESWYGIFTVKGWNLVEEWFSHPEVFINSFNSSLGIFGLIGLFISIPIITFGLKGRYKYVILLGLVTLTIVFVILYTYSMLEFETWV